MDSPGFPLLREQAWIPVYTGMTESFQSLTPLVLVDWLTIAGESNKIVKSEKSSYSLDDRFWGR